MWIQPVYLKFWKQYIQIHSLFTLQKKFQVWSVSLEFFKLKKLKNAKTLTLKILKHVESTPLSKCFAKQGIKIPIRKEKAMSATAKKRRAAAASRNNQKFNSDLEEEDEEEDQDDEL